VTIEGENKAVVRRIFQEVHNQQKLELADELFSAECVLHPGLPASRRGPERVKRAISQMHEPFPDLRITIDHMVAEGEMVATRITASGTHAPTGKPVISPSAHFSRLEKAKVVEEWFLTDSAQVEAQLVIAPFTGSVALHQNSELTVRAAHRGLGEGE
jgi:predicted ester cyclase